MKPETPMKPTATPPRHPRSLLRIALLALSLGAPAWSASAAPAEAALTLAQRKGCTACHDVGGGHSSLDDSLPIGPSWQEVAARYAGQPGAERRLVRTLRQGSNPARTHWRGEVSGRAMPAQGPQLTADEARRLVRWILSM